MFYVNNDDMDELFRDAAERYPLKTEGVPDWEKVSELLQTEAGTPFADPGQFKKEKKRRVFFWWLLLLPLGWIGHESWQKINASTTEKKLITASENKQAASTKNARSRIENATSEKINKATPSTVGTAINDVDKKNTANNKKEINTASLASANLNKTDVARKETGRNKSQNNENLVIKNATDKASRKNIVISKQNSIDKNDVAVNNKKANNKTEKAIDNVTVDNEIINNTAKNNIASNNENITTEKNDDNLKKETLHVPAQKNNDDQKNTATKIPDAIVKKENAATPETVTEKKAAKPVVKLQKDFHFYTALMVGADVSTVKFQSVKGMGNSVGLLLGYHFSKSKFNIETGVYWDTKKYYSKGEYFDKSKVSYFANYPSAQLLYVNGNCNMFEIPINVRYNFVQKKSTSFFAVAGISSYLMNKEAYGYAYEESGWQGYENQSYYHSSQNWFSILNLSAGFEHHLGKIGDIRIEPYAKLPLSGIGKGSLSLTSAGLNVGLSRRF